MALLEKITQLKNQGMKDADIIKSLRDEGISPREIYEALSQSEIKSEISGYGNQDNQENMQKSIMNQQQADVSSVAQQSQESIAYPTPQNQQSTMPLMQQYPQYQQQVPQDYQDYQQQPTTQYQDYPYSQPYGQEQYYQQGIDLETVRDISKQVLEESINKLRIQIAELVKVKSELRFQVQNMESRLQKIESTIYDLQTAILKKVGEYGQAISDISEEMKATQQSFSKLINPIIDNVKQDYQEPQYQDEQLQIKKQAIKQTNKIRHTQKSSQSNQKPATNKRGAGFEDYFR